MSAVHQLFTWIPSFTYLPRGRKSHGKMEKKKKKKKKRRGEKKGKKRKRKQKWILSPSSTQLPTCCYLTSVLAAVLSA